MRVLHVISSINTSSGGTAVVVAELAKAQKNVGLDVRIITTERQEPEADTLNHLRSADIAIDVVWPSTGKFQRHPRLHSAVNAAVKDADVVHIHAIWEQIQHEAARIASTSNKPYVFTPHGMLDPWSMKHNRLFKRLLLAWRTRRDLNNAALLHYTAEMERQASAAQGLTPPTVVIANGVDLEEFAVLPEQGKFRRRFGIGTDERLILFLGRLHPKKGLDLLLPAVAALNDKNVKLALAGPTESDEYQKRLMADCDRLGLTNRVTFTGMLRGRERIEALVDANLFVLPSYQENFGIAVIEAVAAGLPVVISDQVAIWRELQDAGVAAVVPTAVEPLCRQLEHCLADPTLQQTTKQTGLQFARQNYGWHQIAKQWKSYYERTSA